MPDPKLMTARIASNANVTVRENAPVHDKDGNVIGKVVDWRTEGPHIVVEAAVDPQFADRFRTSASFSMGTKRPGEDQGGKQD